MANIALARGPVMSEALGRFHIWRLPDEQRISRISSHNYDRNIAAGSDLAG